MYYILVHIVACLEMLGELMVLVVRTTVHVFLQMCMYCLEKRCVLMIGDYLFDYFLVLLEVFGTLLVGLIWGLLFSNFGKILEIHLFMKKIYVFCKIVR